MQVFSCLRRAPLRQDPHVLARRKPETMRLYRLALRLFLEWYPNHSVAAHSPFELDDLLAEWKQIGIQRTQFGHGIAAAELAMPAARGCLTCAHQIFIDWEAVSPPNHHFPMPRALAIIIGFILCCIGFGRFGTGLVLPQSRGLRPSDFF